MHLHTPQNRAGLTPSTAPALLSPTATTRHRARPTEPLGILFPLLLVWLVFEFARPPITYRLPMAISILAFVGWLFTADKPLSIQGRWFMALLAVMVVGLPLAANNYSVFKFTYGMAILLLCICVPLQSLVTSVRRVRLWIYTFLGVATFVGAWAVFHQGFGPSRSAGAQDENYVAALMGMAIPFAYFSIFVEKRMVAKVLLALVVAVQCGATVVGFSRGGFIGLCMVVVYCLWRSPKKLLGFGIVAAAVIAVIAFAGPAYWEEIRTIGDVQGGTAGLRMEIWKIGMRIWLTHPLLGAGAGNFRWLVGDYQSGAQLEAIGRSLGGSIIAHSLYVELLAELGIAGAIAVVAVVWRTWVDLGNVRQGATAPSGRASVSRDLVALRCYADAVRASMLCVLTNGLFLSLLYVSNLWLLVAVGGGLIPVYRSIVAAEPGGPPPILASPRLAATRGGLR